MLRRARRLRRDLWRFPTLGRNHHFLGYRDPWQHQRNPEKMSFYLATGVCFVTLMQVFIGAFGALAGKDFTVWMLVMALISAALICALVLNTVVELGDRG